MPSALLSVAWVIMLAVALFRRGVPLATLAYNAEEIAPASSSPPLYELEGISREAVEAHYKLYEGYIAKRNEILARLANVDLESGNQVYSTCARSRST